MIKDILSTNWNEMLDLEPKAVNTRNHVVEWDGKCSHTIPSNCAIVLYYNLFNGEPNAGLVKTFNYFDLDEDMNCLSKDWVLSEVVDNQNGSKEYSIIRKEIYESYQD